MTACLQQAPANACLDSPNSTQLGTQAPEVSLSNCAAGSNWESGEGEGGGGGVPVEDGNPRWS